MKIIKLNNNSIKRKIIRKLTFIFILFLTLGLTVSYTQNFNKKVIADNKISDYEEIIYYSKCESVKVSFGTYYLLILSISNEDICQLTNELICHEFENAVENECIKSISSEYNGEKSTTQFFYYNNSIVLVFTSNFSQNDVIKFDEDTKIVKNGTSFKYENNTFNQVVESYSVKIKLPNNQELLTYSNKNTYTFLSIVEYPVYAYNYQNTIYKLGDKIDIESDIEIEALVLEFKMEKGASIKLIEGNSGLRFIAEISVKDKQILESLYGTNITYGMIILPTKFFNKDINVQEQFVRTDTINDHKVLDIKADKINIIDNNILFSGVICSIKVANYINEFSARGYIEIVYNGNIIDIYTEYNLDENSRSIYKVSRAVKKDTTYYETLLDNEKQIINDYMSRIIELEVCYDETENKEKICVINYDENRFCIVNSEINGEAYYVQLVVPDDFNKNGFYCIFQDKEVDYTIMESNKNLAFSWGTKNTED